jgi:hypothetical protein
MQWHKWGGREEALKNDATLGIKNVVGKVEAEAKAAVDGVKSAVQK